MQGAAIRIILDPASAQFYTFEKASERMRAKKDLLIASKAFASEIRWLSWWHFWSTLAAFAGLIGVAVSDLPFGICLLASVVAGMVCVRIFIIYHDHQHQTILRDSPTAAFVMRLYGILMLNPPSVWRRSHDHHHKHNSKNFGPNVGSYPVMTTHAYASATRIERFAYAAARHPLTMLFGYATVFFWGMSLRPFLQAPKRHWDGGVSIVLHIGIMAMLGLLGAKYLIMGMLLPLSVASAMGAYLFYAQHNFPSVKLVQGSQWSHVDAALHSSCYISMGHVMNWFTGNIGYHHVHHLNAHIPFYRLPEAMAAIDELQSPGTTTLWPKDIIACLRLKLWNPEKGRFVGFEAV